MPDSKASATFIAPVTASESKKALLGKNLEKVLCSATVIQGKEYKSQSTKVIKLGGS
jgi:hypothetical protein